METYVTLHVAGAALLIHESEQGFPNAARMEWIKPDLRRIPHAAAETGVNSTLDFTNTMS